MKRLLLASVFLSAVACRAAQEPIVPVEPLASPARSEEHTSELQSH